MQTSARADRETRTISAQETSSATTIVVDNAGAAAGRDPVTSRRNFLMNTAVSLASLASAAAIASPSIADTDQLTVASAQLERAKQMIGFLRDRYITEGWKLDEDLASRVLRYFSMAVDHSDHGARPEYEGDWESVRAFVIEYDQSFDWLLAGDISGMICKAAASSPAASRLTSDPIFEAIERHKRVAAALSDALSRESRAQREWQAEHGSFSACVGRFDRTMWEAHCGGAQPWPFTNDEVAFYSGAQIDALFKDSENGNLLAEMRSDLAGVKRRHRAVFQPLKAETARLHDALSEAEQELAAAPPITSAGAVALLRYMREDQFAWESLTSDDNFMSSMLASVELVMCEQVGMDVPIGLSEMFEDAA